MSDENKKQNAREPEFYDLLRRNRPKPSAEEHSAEDSRPAARDMEQTRLTDLSRAAAGEHSAEASAEPPVEPPRRPARDFQLRVDDELDKIPDCSQTGTTKHRKSGSAFLKAMSCLLILGISVLLSVVILFCVQEMFGFGKEDRQIEVEIPRNAGLSVVAEKLEATQVIRSAALFKVYFKLTEPVGEFQYGTYELNSRMSYDEMITSLFQYSTNKEEVTVTFPEGFTLYQMAQRLEESGVCEAQDFIDTLNEYDFAAEHDFLADVQDDPLRYHKLEGYLFPDTYNFYLKDAPVNVAGKMLRNFGSKIAALEERMTEMGLTLEQTVTIASIVQQEAGHSTDMTMVASVYWNRIRNEGVYPNLQADPTRNYAEELMEQMGENADPAILAAYNTYEGAGLPPGAICNPGYDALEATLNPAESDYFYFCNNLQTGEFFFAKTLREHEYNLSLAGLV